MDGGTGDAYLFEHLLTREAAYRALLGKNRQVLHGLAADALAALIKPGTADEWQLLPHLIEHLNLAARHSEAHLRCCELLFIAASSGQHDLFEQFEREAETQLLLAQPEAGPEQRSAALELARGERIFRRMDYIAARPPLARALELATVNDDRLVLCRAERRMATLDFQRGETELGAQRLQRSLELARELGDESSLAATYSMLGFYAVRSDHDYAAAEEFYRMALRCAEQAGDLRAETTALNNYGILLHENLGRLAEAEENWSRALAVNRAFENRVGEAINADNLGGLLLGLGRLEQASDLLRLSVQRYAEVGDRPGVGSAGAKLGLALLRSGRLIEARAELHASRAILEQLDEEYWLGYTFSYLGELELACANLDEAHTWFNVALNLGQALDEPQLLHAARMGLATCALEEASFAAAYTELDAASSAAERNGGPAGRAECHLLRAKVLLRELAGSPAADAALIHSRIDSELEQAERLIAGLQLAPSTPLLHSLAELQTAQRAMP